MESDEEHFRGMVDTLRRAVIAGDTETCSWTLESAGSPQRVYALVKAAAGRPFSLPGVHFSTVLDGNKETIVLHRVTTTTCVPVAGIVQRHIKMNDCWRSKHHLPLIGIAVEKWLSTFQCVRWFARHMQGLRLLAAVRAFPHSRWSG